MLSWMEWNKIFLDNYTGNLTPNKKERRRLYQEYKKEKEMNSWLVIPSTPACVSEPKKNFGFGKKSLACVADKPCPTPTIEWSGYQEGINPMNYASATVQAATSEIQDQRKYLANRLDEVFYKKSEPLYAHFGLTDDEAPTSPKELAKRIADGKFTIKGLKESTELDEYDDGMYYHGYWTSLIRWRDPAKKADQDGYDAAMAELKKLKQEALDTIKIDEPKAGLDAVKALEAWEPKGAAN